MSDIKSVAWQFKDDGEWHTGTGQKHRKNTEKAGYKVRDLYPCNQHDTLISRVSELEASLNKIRNMVTDIQDGFEITGGDAEILDEINEVLEAGE